MKIEIKKVRDGAIIPQYQTAGAAAVDLHACIDSPINIAPENHVIIPTGIAVHIKDPLTVGKIYTRSGNGFKHGIVLRNNVGIIDADYLGEIMVCLLNTGFEWFEINPDDRIAQMIFTDIERPIWLEVDEFSAATKRGAKGFGSTGV